MDNNDNVVENRYRVLFTWCLALGGVLTFYLSYIWVRLKLFVRRTDASVALFGVFEIFKYALERADLVRQKIVQPTDDFVDDMVVVKLVPVVGAYSDPVYYSYKYVIPALQFTALFQVFGVRSGVFQRNNYSLRSAVVLKGVLKATSSCFLNVKNKIAKKNDVHFSDFIMPFTKEPVVSLCKVGFDVLFKDVTRPITGDNNLRDRELKLLNLIDFIQKPICNFVGEFSYNTAKYIAGKQKLSTEELLRSIPLKVCWKTFHQGLEGQLTSKLDVAGFYVGSIIPRSWGNDFIEEVARGEIEMNSISLPINATYYVCTMAIVGGTALYFQTT